MNERKRITTNDNTIFHQITVNQVTFEMVPVKGGSYNMGGDDDDADIFEGPVHLVNVSQFEIGRTPVTQALWEAVMGTNPSQFKGHDLPVEMVSYDDCQEFLEKLNGLTGLAFRLPTEEEWEFAARGGNRSHGHRYGGNGDINSMAWYRDNSNQHTNPVGTKRPNELGIYDMIGNVDEWTSSKWREQYDIPMETTAYVIRGGSWLDEAKSCRVSCRDLMSNDGCDYCIGLRLAL